MNIRSLAMALGVILCAASSALSVLGEEERQLGLDNICRNGGTPCDPLNGDDDCPSGPCEPGLVPAGKPNKFKGRVTIITDENLAEFDNVSHENPHHQATTLMLQLKGRFGGVEDPILAQTYQTTGAASSLPLFPDNVEPSATSNTAAEGTLGQLWDFGVDNPGDDAALRLRTLDCEMTSKLRSLLGLATGTPIIVKAKRRNFSDQSELSGHPGLASVLV